MNSFKYILQCRLDGLNKHLDEWDSHFYMSEFRSLCVKEKMNELKWPLRDYVVQIARFDLAKGIPNVIDSYAKFRKMLQTDDEDYSEDDMPQLLICGHGAGIYIPLRPGHMELTSSSSSVDDPDASIIYDQIMQLIHSDEYREYAKDMVVMRLPPSDQRASVVLCFLYQLTNA